MENKKIMVSDGQLAACELRGAKRNKLCPLPAVNVAASRYDLSQAEQSAVEIALRPKCVTVVNALLYNDGLLKLLSAARDGNAVLMGREDDSFVLTPCGPGEAVVLLAALLSDGESNADQEGVELPFDSFLLLLAIADCCKRRYLDGLLRNQLVEELLTMKDLMETIEESYTRPDSRWLFPFVLSALNFPVIGDMQAALNGLYGGGILEQTGLKLTEGGQGFVEELLYRQSAAHLQTLRVQDGALMEENMLFLRTHEALWCAMLGEDSVEMTTISENDLLKLTTVISEELDDPAEDTEAPEAPEAPKAPAKKATQKRDAPARTPTAESWQCACGSVNKGSFCPKCGAKRPATSSASASASAPDDGSWQCACGRRNKGSFCPNCGAKRP